MIIKGNNSNAARKHLFVNQISLAFIITLFICKPDFVCIHYYSTTRDERGSDHIAILSRELEENKKTVDANPQKSELAGQNRSRLIVSQLPQNLRTAHTQQGNEYRKNGGNN